MPGVGREFEHRIAHPALFHSDEECRTTFTNEDICARWRCVRLESEGEPHLDRVKRNGQWSIRRELVRNRHRIIEIASSACGDRTFLPECCRPLVANPGDDPRRVRVCVT